MSQAGKRIINLPYDYRGHIANGGLLPAGRYTEADSTDLTDNRLAKGVISYLVKNKMAEVIAVAEPVQDEEPGKSEKPTQDEKAKQRGRPRKS